jgi:hypothetical protein
MNQLSRKSKQCDFEEFGRQTRFACADRETAIQICSLRLLAYERELQPELSKVNTDILANRYHGAALHAHLYDRPIPVSDAAMLTHSNKCRILLVLTALASIACVVGNTTTLVLLGFEMLLSLVGAIGITALPLVVGHLAYEKIVASHRGLQVLVILAMAVLCFGALLNFGAARRDMFDRATAPTGTNSYVDEPSTAGTTTLEPEPKSQENSESKIRQTLGQALLLFMIAADIALGFLVGSLVRMHTDEDYTAWRTLKRLRTLVADFGKKASELIASIEIAKKQCMEGILRAENMLDKRRRPGCAIAPIASPSIWIRPMIPRTARNSCRFSTDTMTPGATCR